jgi:hypothetical protein
MKVWAIVAMATLAVLDLTGAVMAKELAVRPRLGLYAIALAVWTLLFVVYVRSIGASELWVVTFGWITMLQVGVVLVDRFRYGADVSTRKWILVVVLLAVQLALLLPERSSAGAAE